MEDFAKDRLRRKPAIARHLWRALRSSGLPPKLDESMPPIDFASTARSYAEGRLAVTESWNVAPNSVVVVPPIRLTASSQCG